jgi:hypothetical protein
MKKIIALYSGKNTSLMSPNFKMMNFSFVHTAVLCGYVFINKNSKIHSSFIFKEGK